MHSDTAKALLVLARPQGALFVALLPILGYWFAFWDHGKLVAPVDWIAAHLVILAIWSLCHFAAMWLNAALDRDGRDVLWARATGVPEGIDRYAYAALAIALALAFWRGLAVGSLALGCALLAVLYSHPRAAWKGHAWLGPATNVLGYGLLAPLTGFFLAGLPLTWRSALALGLIALSIAATYFAAQAFQEREDRARGYRTYVARNGSRRTLRLVRGLLNLAVGGLLLASAAGYFPRIVLTVAIPFFFVDRYLRRWSRQPRGGDACWAQGFLLRLLIAVIWGFLAVCAVYLVQEWTGAPRGGLGTARGHPA